MGYFKTTQNTTKKRFKRKGAVIAVLATTALAANASGVFSSEICADDELDTNSDNSIEDLEKEESVIKEVLDITVGGLFKKSTPDTLEQDLASSEDTNDTEQSYDESDDEPSWFDDTVDIIFGGLSSKKRSFEYEKEDEYVSVNSEEFTSKARNIVISDSAKDELAKVAKSHLNTGIKYKWGGKSGLNLDCSGYISVVLNEIGAPIDRYDTNAEKYYSDSEQVSRDELEIGDLVFWHDKTGKKHAEIYHIGIYVGNDTLIDCSTEHKGLGTRKVSNLKDSSARSYSFGRHPELQEALAKIS